MTTAPTSTSNAPGRTRPFALTLLYGLAALTITLAGVRSISDIIGPAFLALVITISLHPIRLWLEGRHRLPEWAASLVMLVAACGLLLALTLALVVAVARLADLLPQYTDQMQDSVEDVGNSNPVAALDNFARGARNYMGVSAGFGLIVAVIDGVVLQVMGVPGAFVWAVLAFVTRADPT
jgi:predicted PurR-regulated permease PerM